MINTKSVGRPRKQEQDKVTSTHSKFTVTLSNENKDYLLTQKSKGEIKNVSILINELIDTYRTI